MPSRPASKPSATQQNNSNAKNQHNSTGKPSAKWHRHSCLPRGTKGLCSDNHQPTTSTHHPRPPFHLRINTTQASTPIQFPRALPISTQANATSNVSSGTGTPPCVLTTAKPSSCESHNRGTSPKRRGFCSDTCHSTALKQFTPKKRQRSLHRTLPIPRPPTNPRLRQVVTFPLPCCPSPRCTLFCPQNEPR